MDVLRALHEHTRYRVKGNAGLSDEWLPARGLREGCATSPILFNLYHAVAVESATMNRKESAEAKGMQAGLAWGWVPANSLPPIITERARQATNKEGLLLSESLFADGTTLIGWTQELNTEKEVVKKTLGECEEKCHDGKEENVSFESGEIANTRMLGTRIGLKEDVEARLKRGYHSWSKVKQWLWKSNLGKRTRAIFVQGVVDSTPLFDNNTRAWTKGAVRRLQSLVDKCYRHVWSGGKGQPLRRIDASQKTRTGHSLASIRTKPETRALERLGHILRMPQERLVKRVVLGQWMEPQKSATGIRGGIIPY